MATATEESFKVCGLCSQLVDESVEITAGMRMFLCGFLTIQEATLPSKVCLECYQKAMDCRSFKERCDKAIHKLHKRALYSSMILGGSPAEIAMAIKKEKEHETTNNTKIKNAAELDTTLSNPPTALLAKAGAAKKGNLTSKSAQVLTPPLEIECPGPRSRRSSANFAKASPASGLRSKSPTMPTGPTATTPVRNATNSSPGAKVVTRGSLGTRPKVTPPANALTKSSVGPKTPSKNMGFQPKVVIKYKDKEMAEMAEKALKKISESATTSTTKMPPKNESDIRKRKGDFSRGGPKGKKQKMDDETKKVTSSGRVVKSKKKFIFDDFGGIDEDSALESGKASKTNQVVAKKSPPAKMDAAAPKFKPGPKTRKKQTLPVEETAEKEPAAISDDEDTEEIFPTVGPYQCEICQKITDTKQEFVDHIKKSHIDVVDEEVLRSLEGDLRKSRKKMEIAISRMPGKSPVGKKKSKPASKKGSVKANVKKSPIKKDVSKTPKPKEDPVESRTCKICKSVLSSASKREHERHRKSKYCMGISIENSAAETHAQDPLSTSPKKGSKKEETADELAERTCQFCGKVLKKKTDLSGHYKTKVCVTRQYEREENQDGGDAANATTKDSNTPKVLVENAELDEGNATTAAISGLKESSFVKETNLPALTASEVQVVGGEEVADPAPFAKAEHSPNPIKTVQSEPMVEEPMAIKLQNSSDWLDGPTTISDTCNGTLNQGEVDPLTSEIPPADAADPLGQTPGAILGNGVVHSPNDNASMF